MKHIIEEQVLVYEQKQLDKWKNGDKSLIPDFMEKHNEFYKQHNNHFGEIFVISKFHQRHGWKGFYPIALGTWEPDNRKYDSCRDRVRRLFPIEKLLEFREVRKELDFNRKGVGEPDVMLFDDNKNVLFLEVKKGRDTVKEEQFSCLAHIKSILKADVGIVYLREENQNYTPKRYELDLVNYCGEQI